MKQKDYIFTYIGYDDPEEFICSAENGDEALKKFKDEIGAKTIIKIEII